MLPVAKIVAANITRLIDQLQDRPDREVLAGKMGMSGKTLGNLRAGTGNPTLKNIAGAAKYLKVEPWELLHPSGPAASQSARLDDATMAQALELIYLMADARPEDAKLRRPVWATILIAAKAIDVAEGDLRKAMAQFLEDLQGV